MTRTPTRLLIVIGLLPAGALAQAPSRLPDFDRRTPVVIAVENVSPSVVNIRAQAQVRATPWNWGLFQRPTEEDPATGRMFADSSLGSGVVVHPDGFVVTNEHVTHGADRLIVKFQDGREAPATLVNANQDSDIALLRLDGKGPFPAAELGDSAKLMVGETTIALGNPFGLSSSATTGILSATGRSVRFQGRTVFDDFIQTSALINPGNSGGPLLDINGRVVGINVAIDSRGQGIGFAIPINRVKDVLADLVNPEILKLAWLGIEPATKDGQLVAARVAEDGPAAGQGVQAGDRILAVENRPVLSAFEFNVALLRAEAGTPVRIRLEGAGRAREVSIPLTPIPLSALVEGQNTVRVLGLECGDLTPKVVTALRLPSTVAGVVVLEVSEDGKGAALGLKPRDVIVQVGNAGIRDIRQLQTGLMRARRYGRSEIFVYREGEGLLKGVIEF